MYGVAQQVRRLVLALLFQGMRNIVQLFGVRAVVLEHIGHEGQGLLRRELGRALVRVLVVAGVLVRVFMPAGVFAKVQKSFVVGHAIPPFFVYYTAWGSYNQAYKLR